MTRKIRRCPNLRRSASDCATNWTTCGRNANGCSWRSSSKTQKDQETEAVREELDGLRHQLHEELRLAGNSRGHLEAELEFRSQQLFDVQTQLAALQCSRDEQFAQWQSHEKQWHEELEATRAQGEAFQREIESLRFQATEAAARAADHEVSPPVAGDNAADIATWKDVAEGLRRELQQTRDEHRRVREEWHVDRQNLERELNARSTAAQNLEQKYKQDMREAEVLIHAMQQEGKHLLIQLDEAKQSIRQGIEGNKKSGRRWSTPCDPSLSTAPCRPPLPPLRRCRTTRRPPSPPLRRCLTTRRLSNRLWLHPRIRDHCDSLPARRC